MRHFEVYPIMENLYVFYGGRMTGKTYFASKLNVTYYDVGNPTQLCREWNDYTTTLKNGVVVLIVNRLDMIEIIIHRVKMYYDLDVLFCEEVNE